MRAVVQRAKSGSVSVSGEVIGKIGIGLVVLLGVEKGDDRSDADYIIGKLQRMRIFSDENGKMNKSVLDIGGEMLIISQFTLSGDIRKGNRPDFGSAALPTEANELYEYVKSELSKVCHVECGKFGADMLVGIENDGPVTILLDSRRLF